MDLDFLEKMSISGCKNVFRFHLLGSREACLGDREPFICTRELLLCVIKQFLVVRKYFLGAKELYTLVTWGFILDGLALSY